jgi:hypothetical protein
MARSTTVSNVDTGCRARHIRVLANLAFAERALIQHACIVGCQCDDARHFARADCAFKYLFRSCRDYHEATPGGIPPCAHYAEDYLCRSRSHS